MLNITIEEKNSESDVSLLKFVNFLKKLVTPISDGEEKSLKENFFNNVGQLKSVEVKYDLSSIKKDGTPIKAFIELE